MIVGSIRPIQPETMDAASSMVWWVVKYRVGWLSAHCSYHYTRFNGRWSHLSRGRFISVWNLKQLFILRPMYQNKPHCLAYRIWSRCPPFTLHVLPAPFHSSLLTTCFPLRFGRTPGPCINSGAGSFCCSLCGGEGTENKDSCQWIFSSIQCRWFIVPDQY